MRERRVVRLHRELAGDGGAVVGGGAGDLRDPSGRRCIAKWCEGGQAGTGDGSSPRAKIVVPA
ncbi:MAG: hypothetical protein AB7P46_03900 [Thermoanaerobaculia bacterium]